jgi:transcriptional regulator with GAF, ATPase, and Fis domain
MGVSLFPGVNGRRPEVEEIAADICTRLADSSSPQSVDERIRQALARLVDGLTLEGGLFIPPAGREQRPIAVGTALMTGRVIVEFLGRPRVQSVSSESDMLLIAGAPQASSPLPPDDQVHLSSLGVRTLMVLPLRRGDPQQGAIAIYSQRSHPQWDGGTLEPLMSVVDAIDLLVGDRTIARPVATSSAPTTFARRPPNGTERSGERERTQATSADDALVGESAAWRYVIFRLDQVAATHATVLLLGETGTGKELVARAIHRRSPRSSAKFIALNCAALPPTLVESELFGRERGAFTGAHSSQPGRFELAHRGTLFLDEVGDLPIELQPKLLRVLQEGQLERLGSTRTVDVDVRVIAATNRDLAEEVRQNQFRGDLYYRLNVFPISLPSLRDRREDIPLLAQHLSARYARQMHKAVRLIPDSVSRALQQYDWPGNIRELENVIHRAMILSGDGVISIKEISLSSAKPAAAAGTTLEEIERNHIERMLSTTLWRIEGRRGAAELLGLKPSTLRSRLRKLGIRRGA